MSDDKEQKYALLHEKLNASEALIVGQHDLRGKSIAEIANCMKLSMTYVSQTYSSAITHLESCFVGLS